MTFNSLHPMWVAGKKVEVLPSAQRLFANRLRVPYSYINRCPAELQAENLKHWQRQDAQRRDTFFCRFNKGDRLRAVFTARYHAYVGVPYQDDPYAPVCESPEERNIFKRVMVVAINCPQDKDLVRVISGKLAEDGYASEYRKPLLSKIKGR